MPDVQEVFRIATQKVHPDEGFVDRQRQEQRRRSRNRRMGAYVLVAALGVVAVMAAVGTALDEDDPSQPATRPTPPEPDWTQPKASPLPPRAPWFDRNVAKMCGDEPGGYCGEDYLLDLRTGEMTPLPASIVSNGQSGYAISPDGSEVAYYGRSEDGLDGLFVARLDGTQIRLIASNARPNQCCPFPGGPGWSPDGTRIAYVARPDGDVNSNIFVVDLRSGVTTQVTFETVDVSGAQFTADGSSIAYTAFRPSGSKRRVSRSRAARATSSSVAASPTRATLRSRRMARSWPTRATTRPGRSAS